MRFACEIANPKPMRTGIVLEFADNLRERVIRTHRRATHDAPSGIFHIAHHCFMAFAKPIPKAGIQKLIAGGVPAEAEDEIANAGIIILHSSLNAFERKKNGSTL